MGTLTFAILKERKHRPDRRVVFSPESLITAQKAFPDATFIVESSQIRVFSDSSYTDVGITVTDDISVADVLLGVKEVPPEALLPGKTYVFFSHTIKKQSYNKKMLQEVIDKKITLYDHELFTDHRGTRLIGFGYYAGLAGTYNGFRTWGMRKKTWSLPVAGALKSLTELKQELRKLKLPPMKICLTGMGRVASGVRELLEDMKIAEVAVDDFLNQTFDYAVFCNIDVLDYNKHRKRKDCSNEDFYKNPQEFEPDFLRFAKTTDFLITAHYYDPKAPILFSKEDAKSSDFNIRVVADISCDVNGPIASTIRSSSIEDPIYGYDRYTGKETAFDAPGSISVMAVDNLPCELARDSSTAFGRMFMDRVLPAFFNGDKDFVLERACIVKEGRITPKYRYLQEWVDERE